MTPVLSKYGASRKPGAVHNLLSEELKAVSEKTWKIVLSNIKELLESD